jgi:hypothetical protein
MHKGYAYQIYNSSFLKNKLTRVKLNNLTFWNKTKMNKTQDPYPSSIRFIFGYKDMTWQHCPKP